MLSYFHQSKRSDISRHIQFRKGETKLGEVTVVPGDVSLDSFLKKTSASFIILGIAEDIGVLANYGSPGATTAWNSFLSSFLNIQANDFIRPDTIAVLGNFSFDPLKEQIENKMVSPEEKIEDYRKAVTIIDDAVSELIRLIVKHQKLPIIVGGGHNNCYPIMKGAATALSSSDPNYLKGINCVNLDAHIDYRLPEGRHSGNGFRYAKQENFLRKYFALGVHENHMPANVLNELGKIEDIAFMTYEDIFIRQKKTWMQSLEDAGKFIGFDHLLGIELDLDSIQYVPASAPTPCGITSREAMQYIQFMASHYSVGYVHICEGIALPHDRLTGKLISYIVSHFVKTYLPKNKG